MYLGAGAGAHASRALCTGQGARAVKQAGKVYP